MTSGGAPVPPTFFTEGHDMKDYLILKDFSGSQDGIACEEFISGTTRKLSDSLIDALGGPTSEYAKEAVKAAKEIAAAPTELADAVLDVVTDADEADPEDREKKVTGPTETKPAKGKAKK